MDDATDDQGFSRQLALNELTSGQEVTHLLSHINQNFKQSKADQILRLLHDQDKLSDGTDDSELIQEYDQIREEKVVCDSDTLSESSSDAATQITLQEDNNGIENDINERKKRCRTSMGFSNGIGRERSDVNESENRTMDRPADTRERSARPKSSYVRRPFRRRDELVNETESKVVDESVNTNSPRPVSARPRARYGSAAARKVDRKIEMFISGEINTLSGEHLDIRVENSESVPFRNRFSMTRTPKRESKKAKKFCDDNNSAKLVNLDTVGTVSGVHVADVREEVHEVQINSNSNVQTGHVSTITGNVPRTHYNIPKTQPVHTRHDNSPVRSDHQVRPEHPSLRSESYNVQYRSEVHMPNRHPEVVQNPPPRKEMIQNEYSNMDTDSVPPANIAEPTVHSSTQIRTSHVSVRRNDSASGNYRPQNPQPVQSRPLEAHPSTRRRLTRRFIQPSVVQKSSSIRPTSESVLLARQKTEKNLIKKQMDTRPQSEKIVLGGANKILSIAENPAQGPQTSFLTSKGGVPQPSHVQNGGFRGYDPSSRMKSSTRSRDLPGDVTLPRKGQANVMLGGRKPLALMKLPPLEALAAAKKKERGLQLAARETCV